MREIKFRGKPKQTGGIKPSLAWTYGDLVQKNEKKYIAPSHNRVKIENDLARLMILIEVDPKTVGQYTGLQDRNGVDIYEGDVLKITFDQSYVDKPFYIGVVTYRADNGYPAFDLEPWIDCDMNALSWLKSESDPSVVSYEVIGNRFDNPELLEEVRE